MNNRKNKKKWLWSGLILSPFIVFYAGSSVIFYAWLNAAEPERWPNTKAAIWAGGSLTIALFFCGLFVYCLISLIRGRRFEIQENSRT
tara:strand:- start:132 stop:395 length:264 start_codon:yes stop_codon:yes gene_type:complete